MEYSKASVLVPYDSIESYIRTLNTIPFLTKEEEYDLAIKFKENGDLEAAKKLVLSHMRFVVRIAKGYLGYGLPLSDLIQEGTVGLMKAVKRFDVNQGVRLASFAIHWIKAEINDFIIKNWRMVKIATTKAQRKLFFKLRQAKKKLGWFSSNEVKKVADDLGVSELDVSEMDNRLSSPEVFIDESLDEDSPTLESNIEDVNSDFSNKYELLDYRDSMSKKLNLVLGNLDDRSYYIIKRRWLDSDKATLQNLSEELGISIERTRQLEKTALAKVKNSLMSLGVAEA
ncbi:MAG: RNA polymerase sigma factor RpoH [Succinivibrionaceae bacterium]